MKKVLIINGNPVPDSLSAAFAKQYFESANGAGAECKLLHIREMNFDLNLHQGYRLRPVMEKDVIKAQEDIKWAEHLVLIYPVWWASFPALFKGFIDRVFTPGFAFKYRENSQFWDKYLTQKSARLIVTMDAPTWYYKWMVGQPGIKAIKKGTLEFSGIKPVKVSLYGKVKFSTESQRKLWLKEIEKLAIQEI